MPTALASSSDKIVGRSSRSASVFSRSGFGVGAGVGSGSVETICMVFAGEGEGVGRGGFQRFKLVVGDCEGEAATTIEGDGHGSVETGSAAALVATNARRSSGEYFIAT